MCCAVPPDRSRWSPEKKLSPVTIGPLLWRPGWKKVVELGICSTLGDYLDSGEVARGIRGVSDIKTVANKS